MPGGLAGVAMIMEHPGKGKRGAPATPLKAENMGKKPGFRWGGEAFGIARATRARADS